MRSLMKREIFLRREVLKQPYSDIAIALFGIPQNMWSHHRSVCKLLGIPHKETDRYEGRKCAKCNNMVATIEKVPLCSRCGMEEKNV